ncbi:aminomethyl-transferring glycine dehydrogenase subunit GcvPB [candidate division KSB1 bacterium]|nr:aminomethyl-transferring glycine dehydrogenase subunit GcvPB [candidate division KSB1 bacterium]
MLPKLLFEMGSNGREGVQLPELDVPARDLSELIPMQHRRKQELRLPQLSEPEVVRHFVNLSTLNHHVDKGFYPLGSCTMKYNPKINEETQSLTGFRCLHPHQPEETVQGALELMFLLGRYLQEIAGLDGLTLQPAAGAHGELTGLMLIYAYHQSRGNTRKHILIPDSAHGTNPASVSISGYSSKQIPSNDAGLVDLEHLRRVVNEDTAALMLTNPNTLGIFETQVDKVAKILHDAGALMYMDGANLNALVGMVRPGDLGFDVVHFNLHKTFSTPHGGGGPGAGPVGVSKKLIPFLPLPCIVKESQYYTMYYDREQSIGKLSTFLGNFAVLVRAYTYICMLGSKGLKNVSKNAIINANYLYNLVKDYYHVPYKSRPMHEFVLSGDKQKAFGIKTLDIAKRLLDFGVHAPTVYFPLIVSEALMIEPTETESKDSIEEFAQYLIDIAKDAQAGKIDLFSQAPMNTPVSRLDEASAAKELNIRYEF